MLRARQLDCCAAASVNVCSSLKGHQVHGADALAAADSLQESQARMQLDMDKIVRGLGAERRGKVTSSGRYFGALELLADARIRWIRDRERLLRLSVAAR
ncbi:MAG: hypothetical protein HY332_18780 [Chloroflexi bacterium]|nr:hypothetical protein [Chloroflexota bacterium]